MKKVELGKFGGKPFMLDIPRLIETRLLIMASSGGGKSWLLRRLMEQIHGKVQIILLDVEGDFGTLRDKFDFLITGKDGDLQIEAQHAGLLARRVLELRTDIICDLYEMTPPKRERFVELFLNAMVDSPKNLWHPVMVILDEAHIFAPQQGGSVASNAVAALESRGRKRGFCLIPATQRLSKLNKDVAAECQNKLIGLANMDIDRKRSAEELGFSDKEAVLTLRDLEPGEFYAVGPAFIKGVNKVTIGSVLTRHPRFGNFGKMKHAPAPTARVKSVLSKLSNLPREAEQEVQDLQTFRSKVRDLEAQLRVARSRTLVEPAKPVVDPKAIDAAYSRGEKNQHERLASAFKTTEARILEDLKAFKLSMEGSAKMIRDRKYVPEKRDLRKEVLAIPPTVFHTAPIIPRNDHVVTHHPTGGNTTLDGKEFGRCERAILAFLSLKPGQPFTKAQVGAMSGYAQGSGGFNNALSKLGQAGLIHRNGGQISLMADVDVSGLIKGFNHSLGDWIAKLGRCERAIYELVLKERRVFTKEEISEATGYASGSGGFNNALSRLRTLGLIHRHQDGNISLNPELEGF